jgi:hypothetical protein
MSRARNIKPGFFKNDRLAECDPLARILFAGLWCEADRDGRLEDRPKRLKAEYLGYDDCDADVLLSQLAARDFIKRYTVEGNKYIQVLEFKKHQNPHVKEQKSTIPAPCKPGASQVQDTKQHSSCRADSPSLIPDSSKTASQSPSPDDPAPAAMLLPLNDGTEFPITEEQVREFSDLYPAVDVPQSLRSMRAWCVSNPANRKTRNGVLRFVNRWLSKEQDNAKVIPHATPTHRESASERVARINAEAEARSAGGSLEHAA